MQSSILEGNAINAPRGQWVNVYIPHPDEVPMTFQVGIVGTDGVLLASDRRYTHYQPGGYRTGACSSKIIWDGGNIACCSSGTQWAADAAMYCINRTLDSNIRRHIEAGCRNALEACGRLNQDPERFQGSVMLAYRQNGLTELWFSDVRAVFLQEGIIEASPARRVLNRQYAGDAGNSAVFFLEKYLVSGVSSPIDSLKFIAAHAVLMAGKLNPAGVEGLEILLCRHGAAFERVPDAELMELAAESDSLDSEMLNRLLP